MRFPETFFNCQTKQKTSLNNFSFYYFSLFILFILTGIQGISQYFTSTCSASFVSHIPLITLNNRATEEEARKFLESKITRYFGKWCENNKNKYGKIKIFIQMFIQNSVADSQTNRNSITKKCFLLDTRYYFIIPVRTNEPIH